MKAKWVFLTSFVCFFFGFIGCLAVVPPKKVEIEKIVEVEKPVTSPEHKRNAHNIVVCVDTLRLYIKLDTALSSVFADLDYYLGNPNFLLIKAGEVKEIRAQIDAQTKKIQAPPEKNKNNIINL